jgi:RNA polymerase sigma-32 factor
MSGKQGVQYKDIAVEIRSQAMKEDLLGREEEVALARAWRERGDKDARDRLIRSHQKLVIGMARRFERLGVPIADLFNEGIIALIIAANKFDPESGNRFATYAQWWVLTYLQEFVQQNTTPVRLGRTRTEKAVFRAIGKARKGSGPALDAEAREKIAKDFNISIDTVYRIEAATMVKGLSLNQPVSPDESNIEYIDIIPDENEGVEKIIERDLVRARAEVISRILEQLDEREARVINERFLADDPKTLRELASDLGISAERVRQIERETLHRMRRLIERAGLTADDLIGATA